jgi:DNA-binding NtrC family response regulator
MEFWGAMKILVVDDEHLVRWFLERALKKWGHEVVSVSNVYEAMSLLRNSDFDVLFTDLRMPEGNGAQLAKQVCDLPKKNLKVVICSAFITNDMVKDFKEQGILTLKKPFKLAELEKTLMLCTD